MITKEQLIGMLLVKGKFRAKVHLNPASAIGYSVSFKSAISSNDKMILAMKRTLNQLGVEYFSDGDFRIIFGKKGSMRLLEILPESMDELNAGLPSFREISLIVKDGGHKTLEGLEKIFEIMGYENGSNEHEQ